MSSDRRYLTAAEDGQLLTLDGTYHACEARYAGRYLAEFACRFNRRYELADLAPRLVYLVVRIPPLPDRLLTLAGTAGQSGRCLDLRRHGCLQRWRLLAPNAERSVGETNGSQSV